MPKGNEDLKAKIARIQNKAKIPSLPEPQEDITEEEDTESMEALEKEFEERKQALAKKAKPEPQEDTESSEAGIEQAIAEYSDEGKFRVELVFQLVQLNKSFKEIADTLKDLTKNDK